MLNRQARPAASVSWTLGVAGWLLAAPAMAQESPEWPGFRGSTGSGVAEIALDVSTLAPEVLWRVEVGSGYSGVAVAGGRLVTLFDDGGQFAVALDADTGAELWRRWIAESHPGHDGSWDGPISTPVIHAGVVAALEPWGKLFALDAASGEPLWSVHLAEDLGAPPPVYGFASSPLVVGDTLIINVGGESGTVIGFDLRTGEQRWSVGTESTQSQVPVLARLGGRDVVVTAGATSVFAIEPASGELLWQYEHGGRGARGADSLVPVDAGDGRLFLTHGGDSSQLVLVEETADGLVAEQAWDERTIRSTYVPAVYHDGYLYGYNLRILVCVDAATGALAWRSRNPGDGFPTIVDGLLFVLTKDGNLHIANATPEGYDEIVGVPIFDELVWTPPSLAYGDVFARSRTHIARVDLNGAGSRAITAADFAVPRSLDPGDGEFGRFVRAVEAAEDPAALIDAFFAVEREYPIRETDSLVHFVYRGPGEDIAITGDLLGTRQDVAMERVGRTDLHYYTTELIPESRLQYAFFRDGEMITDPLNPLVTSTMIYNAEREHTFRSEPLAMSELRMPRWVLPRHLREPDPTRRGTVERIEFEDDLGDYHLNVYLPHGYADSIERYPVVYFHGPSAAEISMIPTALDNLVADGMRPLIAVWLDDQFGAWPGYPAYWADVFVPTLDTGYRTIASAEGRVHVGTGLGALAALWTATEYPDQASGLALLSIRALDTQWDPLIARFGPAEEHPLRMYVEWGVYGMRNPQEVWDNRTVSAARAQQFRDRGYEVAGGEVIDTLGWASWRNRLDVILEAILPPAASTPHAEHP